MYVKTHSRTSILFCNTPGLSGTTTKYSFFEDAEAIVPADLMPAENAEVFVETGSRIMRFRGVLSSSVGRWE